MKEIKNYLSKQKIRQQLEQSANNPNSLDNLYSLATRQLLRHEYELCLDTLDKIAALYNPTSQFYVNRSLCLIRLNRLTEAIESLEKCLELDETNQDGKVLLQKLQEKIERLRKYTMEVYN